MKRIVTGDETWVYEFDMQISQPAYQPTEPTPKKPRRSLSKLKDMLTVFLDYRVVVHWEFLPEGQTVNKKYYKCDKKRLREQI